MFKAFFFQKSPEWLATVYMQSDAHLCGITITTKQNIAQTTMCITRLVTQMASNYHFVVIYPCRNTIYIPLYPIITQRTTDMNMFITIVWIMILKSDSCETTHYLPMIRTICTVIWIIERFTVLNGTFICSFILFPRAALNTCITSHPVLCLQFVKWLGNVKCEMLHKYWQLVTKTTLCYAFIENQFQYHRSVIIPRVQK